jgi:hypothetical protein
MRRKEAKSERKREAVIEKANRVRRRGEERK